MKGLVNIAELCDIASSEPILCLSETWRQYPFFKCHSFPTHDVITSPATKTHNKGRASGGIAILFNKNIFNLKVLTTDNHFIITNVSYYSYSFILIAIYIPPDSNFDVTFDKLELF